MNIRKKFENYYQGLGYKCLTEKKLLDKNSQNVQFVISSFDNLIPILKRGESDFSYYTVQRTFRTKNSHIALWGNDSFLLPFNIMMSSFSHVQQSETVINESLDFLIKQLHLDPLDLFCVFSTPDKELVCKTYTKYLLEENYICVPETTLKWEAPLSDKILSGRYIKIYKRHYTGFILVMDCNIFRYQQKKVVDITFPQLVVEAITNKYNTVYETYLLRDITKKARSDFAIKNLTLFTCLFVSIIAAMSDGAVPNATREGSSLRKLVRICFFTVDYKKVDLYSYIKIWVSVMGSYNFSTNRSVEEFLELWKREFIRIERNNKYADKTVNECINRIINKELDFDKIIEIISEAESTYGIDHRYYIEKLKSAGYTEIIDIESAFILEHSTCAIPIDYHLKNTNREFLKQLFIERI